MEGSGYMKIETLTWSKVVPSGEAFIRPLLNNVTMLHVNELCLVFRKVQKSGDTYAVGSYTNFCKVINQIVTVPDTLVSKKPFQLYDYIETLCVEGQGGFLEIFARPHNSRRGWVSVGNEAIEFLPASNARAKPLRGGRRASPCIPTGLPQTPNAS